MRDLRAGLPIVEDVHGVQGDAGVEEAGANSRVPADGRLEIGVVSGGLVEEDRRLDRVAVGLERLELVDLPVGLLVAHVRARTEGERVGVLGETECRRGIHERPAVAGDLVLANVGDRIPLRHIAPRLARRQQARRRVCG